MQTALDQLKQLWASGNRLGALKLAAKWPRLGAHKDAIQQGWAAASNPRFYRQLGKDPGRLVAAGIAALKDRYNLEG